MAKKISKILLPAFDTLTKKEQKELLEVSAPRFEQKYNIHGLKSVTPKEKKKGGKNV